jgi:Raf kinase inhibitor-like YbhB/YbcL family protein
MSHRLIEKFENRAREGIIMFIASPAFPDQSTVPTPYTCAGENISPPFAFGDIPAQTKSLVLVVEDSDAAPVPWVHWLVFNIPPTTTSAPAASIPEGGTEGIANGGTHGYEGPCPKYFTGTHHYHFRLFALDTLLDLPATADKMQVEAGMRNHVMDSAVLVGLCEGTKTEM